MVIYQWSLHDKFGYLEGGVGIFEVSKENMNWKSSLFFSSFKI